jgi:hypothetical protein
MVLADAEDVEADAVGLLDLLDQLAQAFRRRHRTAGFVVGGGETVDPNLHGSCSPDGPGGSEYILTSSCMM